MQLIKDASWFSHHLHPHKGTSMLKHIHAAAHLRQSTLQTLYIRVDRGLDCEPCNADIYINGEIATLRRGAWHKTSMQDIFRVADISSLTNSELCKPPGAMQTKDIWVFLL